MPTKGWEYQVMTMPRDLPEFEATLREYGLEGWEICAVVSVDHNSDSGSSERIYFKRSL